MKKKFTIFMTVMLLAFSPMNMYAKSVEDLKKEQAEIDAKNKETKAQLAEAERQKNVTVNEINALTEKIKEVTDQITEVQEELEYTEDLLEKTEIELEEAEQARDEQYENFKTRAKYMYMYGKSSYLDVILKAESFTELIKRVDGVSRVVSYDQDMVNKLLEAEEAVALKLEETEKQKADLEVIQEDYNTRLAGLQVDVAERNKMVKALEDDIAEYNKLVAANEAASNEVESLIKKALEEEARKAAANQTTQVYNYTGGQFQWPAPSGGSISSGYVSRTNPVTGRREYHSGLDIPAPYGTPVVAAEDGVVIYSGWQNGYGYTIIINHGNGVTTLYGHNSSLVARVGQSVTRGQQVAKIGSTGQSTGNHCHFEVRINGSHTNPRPYLGL